jgi:hypothetical protein
VGGGRWARRNFLRTGGASGGCVCGGAFFKIWRNESTIEECGSILIFTRDEKLFDQAGNEIWRRSENVIHELRATSFSYGDRIVIFKEKALHFPTNFQSIGYIEFEADDLTARTAELLKD